MDDPVLDRKAVAEIRDLNPDGFSELIDEFLSSGDDCVLELQEATVAEDTAAVLRFAHALKGNSATFGARRLARCCAELEHAVGDWKATATVVVRVVEEFAAARAALTAMMEGGQTPLGD